MRHDCAARPEAWPEADESTDYRVLAWMRCACDAGCALVCSQRRGPSANSRRLSRVREVLGRRAPDDRRGTCETWLAGTPRGVLARGGQRLEGAGGGQCRPVELRDVLSIYYITYRAASPSRSRRSRSSKSVACRSVAPTDDTCDTVRTRVISDSVISRVTVSPQRTRTSAGILARRSRGPKPAAPQGVEFTKLECSFVWALFSHTPTLS